MDSKTLREKRKKLAEDANAILTRAVNEGRAATPEELQTVDKIHADVDALKATIDRVERSADEARMYAPESQRTSLTVAETPEEQDVRVRAFRSWAMGGPSALSSEEYRALNPQPSGNGTEITLRFMSKDERRQYDRNERENRAQTVTTSAGGYIIAPDFSNRLEKSMLWYGPMLQEADVFDTATGVAMNWPTYDDTSNTGAILAINTSVSNQDIAFGQVTFNSYKYSSKQVLVPVELMQDSAFDINGLVADVLGERLGRILNTHFTTGDASSKPNGIVTAAGTGKTGATGQTTSVIFDDIVDLVYSVDKAYRIGAKFMMNDSTIKALRKLKDGNGLPIWTAGGPTAGEPDTLLGYPVVPNNDMAALGTSNKSILFGQIKKYKIRRVKDITLLRLNERYADAHQVGFLAFARFDGNLLDAGTDPVKLYVNSAT
jgi:HK97 family phage major capsid protein